MDKINSAIEHTSYRGKDLLEACGAPRKASLELAQKLIDFKSSVEKFSNQGPVKEADVENFAVEKIAQEVERYAKFIFLDKDQRWYFINELLCYFHDQLSIAGMNIKQ